MTNDMMLGGLYLLMAMMLVLGSLMSRREPSARPFPLLLPWVAIFGAGCILFASRVNFPYAGHRPPASLRHCLLGRSCDGCPVRPRCMWATVPPSPCTRAPIPPLRMALLLHPVSSTPSCKSAIPYPPPRLCSLLATHDRPLCSRSEWRGDGVRF